MLARFDDGVPALLRHGRVNLVTACFDQAMLRAIVARCVRDAGIEAILLPEGLRLRTRGPLRFAINYSDKAHAVPAPRGARFMLGGPRVEPVGVAAWIEDD